MIVEVSNSMVMKVIVIGKDVSRLLEMERWLKRMRMIELLLVELRVVRVSVKMTRMVFVPVIEIASI